MAGTMLDATLQIDIFFQQRNSRYFSTVLIYLYDDSSSSKMGSLFSLSNTCTWMSQEVSTRLVSG